MVYINQPNNLIVIYSFAVDQFRTCVFSLMFYHDFASLVVAQVLSPFDPGWFFMGFLGAWFSTYLAELPSSKL